MDIDEEVIFNEALELPNPLQRELYLDRVCKGSGRLRDRVTSLLAAYYSSSYLESTPPEITSFRNLSHKTGLVGSQLGTYELLDFLGEGGMGEVYLAVGNQHPRRPVAIKVIKKGMDSQQILARFILEQDILWRLDHPNIAKLVEAGVSDCGRAYFAMELIQGIPITQYCDRERLSINQRIELFSDTCRAIHHAHERGIVHRDIKPANVLISSQAGIPVVKVIDFGVAKAIVESLSIQRPHTNASQIVGTMGYMSPEQARWSSNVDARSDVYSLGALLYELVTGNSPIEPAPDAIEELEAIRGRATSDSIIWPSRRLAALSATEIEGLCLARVTERRQIIRRTRRDLDWIILKALESSPNHRYSTAAEFAQDLRSFLGNRSTIARPPNSLSRITKWSRRHKTALQIVVFLIVLGSVIAGVNVSAELLRRARDGQSQSAAAFSEADAVWRRLQLQSDIQAAGSLVRSGDNHSAMRLLATHEASSRSDILSSFAFQYLKSQVAMPVHELRGHNHDILDMDVSPDQRWIASSDRGGDIIIWDRSEVREVQRLHPNDAEVTRVRFSPDGKHLASAGQSRSVDVWSVAEWTHEFSLQGHELTINGLSWSPDSAKLATGDRDGRVYIWDVASRARWFELPKHVGVVRCLAWSRDGSRLATAEGDEYVRVWDCHTWKQVLRVPSKSKGTMAVAFSDDSRFLAFGGYFNELVVVDLTTGAVVHRSITDSTIASLVFGPQNELIVGVGLGYLQIYTHIRIENTWDLVRIADIGSSGKMMRSVAFAESYNQVIVASEQERLIKIVPTQSVFGFQPIYQPLAVIDFVPQLQSVVVANSDGSHAQLRSMPGNELIYKIPSDLVELCPPEYSQHSSLLALACHENQQFFIKIVSTESWMQTASIPCENAPRKLSFSRDGSNLAIAEVEGLVHVWNVASNEVDDLYEPAPGAWTFVQFSPNSDHLLFSPTQENKLECLDAINFTTLRQIETSYPVQSVLFHPTRDYVIVGELDRITIWKDDLSELVWASPRASIENLGRVVSICITPDHNTVAALNEQGAIRLWDLQTFTEILSVQVPIDGRGWVAFADAQTLLVGSPSQKSLYSIGGQNVRTQD